MLRLVDASVFIDPVVPVESRRPGGTTVKNGLRSLNFWYLRFITHQVSEFATAVSRALHVLDEQVTELRRKVDALEVPPSVVVDVGLGPPPRGVVGRGGDRRARPVAARRVLHAACGDGWLVGVARRTGRRRLRRRPPPAGCRARSSTTWTCATRTSLEHLGAVGLGLAAGVVLSGVVEGSGLGERRRLLEGAVRALAPDGVLVRALPDPVELGRTPTPRSRPTWSRPGPTGPAPGPMSWASSGSTRR